MKVRVLLEDDAGETWRVTDWRSIAGKPCREFIGSRSAEMRLFVNVRTREKRLYRFRELTDAERAPHPPTAKLLGEQLEAAQIQVTSETTAPANGIQIRAPS